MKRYDIYSKYFRYFALCLSLIMAPNAFCDTDEALLAKEKLEAPGSRHPAEPSRRSIGPLQGRSIQESRKLATERTRQACVEWCTRNQECSKCMLSGLCGDGYVVLRSWDEGLGYDWDACKYIMSMPSIDEKIPVPLDPPSIPGNYPRR